MMPTFRQLDGGADHGNASDASSIEKWYERVRDVPFDEFNIEDICRACRQKLCLTYILPLAFKRLSENPRAGQACDGELASAIAGISTYFWESSPALLEQAKHSLLSALPSLDSDFNTEVKSFLYRFGENVPGFPISKNLNQKTSQ